MASKLYDSFKKYEVSADSVEDFINKYHITGQPHKDHAKELERCGYTIISKASSKTGQPVTYYGKER